MWDTGAAGNKNEHMKLLDNPVESVSDSIPVAKVAHFVSWLHLTSNGLGFGARSFNEDFIVDKVLTGNASLLWLLLWYSTRIFELRILGTKQVSYALYFHTDLGMTENGLGIN